MVEYQKEFQYLPVEVAGQLYALPMADVVIVQHVNIGSVPTIARTENGVGDSLVTLDLRRLFQPESEARSHGHAVVVSTLDGPCALLVDAVKTVIRVTASGTHPLPEVVGGLNLPFDMVLRSGSDLMLVLDTRNLRDWLGTAVAQPLEESIDVG